MKKSIILFSIGLSLGSVLLNSACSLSEPPENQVTKENAFKTEKDLNSTTTAIHTILNMQLKETGLQTFLSAGEIMDEERDGMSIRNWNPRSIISSEPDWKGLYDLAFISHYLLDNIGKTEGLSEDRLAYHRGQAYFALGLAYLNIVQRYGDAILLDNSERLTAYGQTPQLTILNKAIEYAQEAYNLLPTYRNLRGLNGSVLTNKQFASKGSATALLAQLYAWKGSVIDNYKLTDESSQTAYQSSIQYASELINGSVGPYSLNANPEELCQKLSNPEADDPEQIFTIAYDRTRDEGTQSPAPAKYYTSWPVNRTATLGDITYTTYRIYSQTVKRLYSDPDDQRLTAFFYQIDQPHVVNDQDYALMYKWRTGIYVPDVYSPSGEEMISINTHYVYWRLAEIYLLRAECYAKVGQIANATQDLNVIRNRAGAHAYPYNGESDLKLAIFREQEKELIGEGSRYWSVLRNGYWRTELQGNFRTLTDNDVIGGALHLPLPEGAYKNNGLTINTMLRQSRYWAQYK